jgi:hypothetical protein
VPVTGQSISPRRGCLFSGEGMLIDAARAVRAAWPGAAGHHNDAGLVFAKKSATGASEHTCAFLRAARLLQPSGRDGSDGDDVLSKWLA